MAKVQAVAQPDTPITLDDVAREAGVSTSTVSRYLSGTIPVSEARRTVIQTAIDKLGYRINTAARALASGRSGTIGVLTQDIASPYYGQVLRGIEQGLAGTGYAPLIVSGELELKDERACIDMLIARQVEGLIAMSHFLNAKELRDVAKRVPLVAVGNPVRGARAHPIVLDNENGAKLAMRHLIELGHRRIAHIAGPTSHAHSAARLAGYKAALEEAGIPFDPDLVLPGDFHEEAGSEGIRILIERGTPFTAVFATNDQTAMGARLALYRLGLRVPEDVSLVGFDDLPGTALLTPPLTTVRQPGSEMGRQAAHAVVALIRGERPRTVKLEQTLVVRESTAQPAAIVRFWRP